MAIKTPILRPLRTNGATMYVFPSASEDIGLNLNNGANGVAMSHYALLNFTKNNFGYTDPKEIINDLLNYVMNHEVSVINDSGYNYQETYTVSEHVFWHWMTKRNTNAISFKETDSTNHNNIYVEDFSSNEDRMVQCFGSIDAGNSLSTEFGMFNETYVSIPTSYGNGPVFFRQVTDNNNYKPSVKYNANPTGGIWGHDQGETQYFLQGYYDNDAICDNDDNTYVDDTPLEIIKDMTSIQKGCLVITSNNSIIMSSYDDVNIDTNNTLTYTSYSMNKQVEFNFNAILLYYSIYNSDDVYKEPIATNLFGIVFLDGGSNTNLSNYILAPFTKKKSYMGNDNNGGYFGNSYSFRVNIKTMSIYDNTASLISDNSTITSAYSLDFSDVIYNLNRAIDIMNTNVQTTSAMQNSYSTILAQNYDIIKKYDDVSTALTNYINEKTANAISTINSSINGTIENLRSELGLDDTLGLSSDGTTSLSKGSYLNRRVVNATSNISSQSDFTYGSTANESLAYTFNDANLGATVTSDTASTQIVQEMLDILVQKNLNLTTQRYINLTALDINFNIKDNTKYASFSLINILEKIDVLQQYIDEIITATDYDVSESKAKTAGNPLFETDDESISLGTSNNYEFENLLSKGIIPVKGILLPRAKKPEEIGYYFKQNTNGNIVSYVYYDGNDYTETNKCEKGKMYTMDSLIYVFNGETCKLLGE